MYPPSSWNTEHYSLLSIMLAKILESDKMPYYQLCREIIINGCWNWWAKVQWERGYSLEVSRHKLLFNFKGKNSNFRVEKTGRHHFNQSSIMTTETNQYYVNWCVYDTTHWDYSITSVLTLTQMHNPNLSMRWHQTNLNWGTFCKVAGPYASKMSNSWKTKKARGIIPDERRQERHGS